MDMEKTNAASAEQIQALIEERSGLIEAAENAEADIQRLSDEVSCSCASLIIFVRL